MSSIGMTVEPIPETRFDEVIEHLRYNFFADEPLNNGVGLCRKGEPHEDLEKHCLATLQQGYCRMLVTDDGTVFKTDATGIFSQKVFAKHGFETVAELPYIEIDEKIRPGPPHKSLKLMVKVLN